MYSKEYIWKQLNEKKYAILDYFIDFKNEFQIKHDYFSPYWNLEMDDWTPFYDKVIGAKKKWCDDMMKMSMLLLDNDPLHIDTKNYKASILRYPKDGYISEHTDFGTLSFLYTNDSGFQFKINDNWIDMSSGNLIIFFGDNGKNMFNINPLPHRTKALTERWSINFFSVPSNIDYPWIDGGN